MQKAGKQYFVVKLSKQYQPLAIYINTAKAIQRNEELKLSPTRVHEACNSGKIYKGYFWRYANTNDLLIYFRTLQFIDIAC